MVIFMLDEAKIGSGARVMSILPEHYTLLARRVDIDLRKMACHAGDTTVYLTGEDCVVKKYQLPTENINKLDLKLRYAPPPLEEKAINCPANVIGLCKNTLVCGLQDGRLHYEGTHIKVNSSVTAFGFSANDKMLAIGSEDGSIVFLHKSLPPPSKEFLADDEA